MSHIMNPKTGRMIRVGGKPWRTLVKDGLIANQPMTPAILSPPINNGGLAAPLESAPDSGPRSIKLKIPLKQKDARPGRLVAKQGHYVQTRKITNSDGEKVPTPIQIKKGGRQEDIAEYTAQCASRTLHKHIDNLSKQLQDAYEASGETDDLNNETLKEFEENLKKLILEEMLTGEARNEPNRYVNAERLENAIQSKKAPVNYETDYEVDEELEDQCDTTRSQFEDQKYEYY